MISFSLNFEGGITHEFCQYAEIGRGILEGRGYRTSMVTPTYLAYLDSRGIPFDAASPAPVLDRFPVQAYLSAAAEGLMGKSDGAIAALSAGLLALCVLATFAAGCRFLTPPEAAVAGLFMAMNPSFQRGFVLWGLVDFGFCLLTLLAAAASFGAPERLRHKAGYWLFAGVLAGLATLTRSNFTLWLPLFLAGLWAIDPKHRVMRLACFSGGALAVAAPLWLYTRHWTGGVGSHPLAIVLADRVLHSAPSLCYRIFSTGDILQHHLPALIAKYRVQLARHLLDFPTLWQMHLVFPAAIAGFLEINAGREPETRAARPFMRMMLAMLAVQVVVFSALRYEALSPNVRGRYFLWFAPAAFLLAARGASAAGRRFGIGRAGLAVFAVVNLLFFAKHLISPQGAWAHPGRLKVCDWPELKAAVEVAGDGLLVSNLPAQAAWYGRHHGVTLPSAPEDLLAIDRRHPIAAILISRLRPGELGYTPAWRDMLADRGLLDKFCRENGFRVERDFGTAVLLGRGANWYNQGKEKP